MNNDDYKELKPNLNREHLKNTIVGFALFFIENNEEMIGRRNVDCIRRYLRGETMESIGIEHNLSPERIRQLIFAGLARIENSVSTVRLVELQGELLRLRKASKQATASLNSSDTSEEIKNKSDGESMEPISVLNLSKRSNDALLKNNISSVNQLCNLSEKELGNLKYFGSKSLEEVKYALFVRGLDLNNLNS